MIEKLATGRPGRSVSVVSPELADGGFINLSAAAKLEADIAAALADDEIGAIVIAGGTRDVFIRHADVAEIDKAAKAIEQGRIGPEAFVGTPFWKLGRTLDAAHKPVIAAIDGACMGGGLEIAAACTMRIASPQAGPIGLPEIRIAIFPGAGGMHRLARAIGWQKARILALTGRTMNGEEAHRLGIIDELANDPQAAAIELARQLAARDQAAIAALLRATQFETDQEQIDRSMEAFGAILAEPNVRQALQDFLSSGRGLHEAN